MAAYFLLKSKHTTPWVHASDIHENCLSFLHAKVIIFNKNAKTTNKYLKANANKAKLTKRGEKSLS